MELKIGQKQQQKPAILTKIDSICEKKLLFSQFVLKGGKNTWMLWLSTVKGNAVPLNNCEEIF